MCSLWQDIYWIHSFMINFWSEQANKTATLIKLEVSTWKYCKHCSPLHFIIKKQQ